MGPRRTLTGEPLEPVLACTAIAQGHGLINGEHVKVVRETMQHLPAAVDAVTRAQIEADLARTAISVGPKELKDNADRTLFLLDQDGPEPDETERERRRGLWKGPQGRDKVIPIKANLTPEAWATWEPILAKWAAPGMCNPADEHPCYVGDADPSADRQRSPHVWPSASTTHSWRSGAVCWQAVSWASTTG